MAHHSSEANSGAVAESGQQQQPASVGRREERCNAILFIDLCRRLERIEKTSGTTAKLSIIFNKDLADIIKGESLFPLVRLLLPLYDTERGRYGLKQATVAKVYIEALQLNKNGPDAKRLIHWKDQSKVIAAAAASTSATVVAGGDFFAILEDVLRPRVREAPSALSLGDVNKLLDDLSGSYGEAGRASFIKEHVLNEMCPLEQKWLMRIIFQDLKVGLKLESVLSEISPWAAQCYNESSNLRMVCEGGAEKKRPKGLVPFSAFSPMLAKGFPRTDQIAETERAMKDNPFVMDLKLDGERMLCHVEGDRVMLVTRNGNDYTSKYASIAADMKQRMLNFDSYILDGEICAYDTLTKKYIPFGSNKTVAKLENNSEAAGSEGRTTSKLVFIAFDIVYASGRDVGHIISHHLSAFQRTLPPGVTFPLCDIPSAGGELTQFPLGVRRAILSACLVVQAERIMIVQNKIVLNASADTRKAALEHYFAGIVDEGEEGLVIKDLLSTYELGEKSRSKNAAWIKMKPEYSDECTDMDMVIMGAYFGEGRSVRGKGVSHFLLGVIDDRSPSQPPKFASVCKVGTGYTYSELTALREKLDAHWHQWTPGTSPSFFSAWKIAKSDDVPHVWIEPENSVILEINCAELIPSTSFAAGMTCRFPRVRKIRYDKEIESTMKFSELRDISQSKSRGIFKTSQSQAMGTQMDGLDGEEGDNESPRALAKQRGRKRKAGDASEGSRAPGRSVGGRFLVSVADTLGGLRSSSYLEGRVFCVFENTFNLKEGVCPSIERKSYSREEIIKLITGNGGAVIANPMDSCLVVCGNKRTIQIQHVLNAKKFDVIDFSYILECIVAEGILPLRPRHYVGASAATEAQWLEDMDEFGDSYTTPVDKLDVEKILADLRNMKRSKYINDLEKKYSGAWDRVLREEVPLLVLDAETTPSASAGADAALDDECTKVCRDIARIIEDDPRMLFRNVPVRFTSRATEAAHSHLSSAASLAAFRARLFGAQVLLDSQVLGGVDTSLSWIEECIASRSITQT